VVSWRMVGWLWAYLNSRDEAQLLQWVGPCKTSYFFSPFTLALIPSHVIVFGFWGFFEGFQTNFSN
jgi:hypothetical protein